MKKFITYLIVACAIGTLSSCATILTKTTQTVKVISDPPNADVEVNGVAKGKTPVDVTLKKGFTGEQIVVKKSGYQTATIAPKTVFNPVAVLNMLGMLGWAVDAATGAMMKYEHKNYEVTLKKQ
ncbi:PEGA domain-containing protein [Pedobacter frigiditerrae]|uniref:PEGA domain-containing protein n=1 Tax=Pedobacter frigiditerrae TaxID=2530452 RepID=A0A4V2MJC8_9SPHI|nr:PEGA domain-containing protein [Pedobacter frigiditerrae]TCC93706.1 PEGA domain-containing protein [Pedobacter frigiditerrae]